jgi:archaellum component FlaG (FlaF/FlaG flagellin family)
MVSQISFDEMQIDVLVDGEVVVTTQGGLSA